MNKILELYNRVNQFGKTQNMQYNCTEPGKVRYTLQITEKHLATPTAVHGGVLAGMMDALLGVTALSLSSLNNKLVSTVEFKIHYLNPCLAGDFLVGEGIIEQSGNRIIVASGILKAENRNCIVAKGIGTFNAYPIEKSGIFEALNMNTNDFLNSEQ